MKLQLMLASVMNKFLGATTSLTDSEYGGAPTWVQNILKPIFSILGWLLPVIMIVLGIAGIIFAIVLGVNYAKAENADAKDEAKKRLINAVVGIVITIVAIALIFIFIKNVHLIFGWNISSDSVGWNGSQG